MSMHNPPHPGEFIAEVYLEPNNISGRERVVTFEDDAGAYDQHDAEGLLSCRPYD